MSSMPPPMPPPPPVFPVRKRRSGCATAAIVIGVIMGIIVLGVAGAFFFMFSEGAPDVPAWVKYPGGALVTSTRLKVPGGVFDHTTMQYQTDDSVEQVAEYYKSEIAKHGGRATAQQDDFERLGVHRIVVKSADDKIEVNIMKPQGRPTGLIIQYTK